MKFGKMKRNICIIFLFVLIVFFSPVKNASYTGKTVISNNNAYTALHETSNKFYESDFSIDGFKKIYESNILVMFFDDENYKLIIGDKRNGYLWKSYVDENSEAYISELSKKRKGEMQALLECTFTNGITSNTKGCMENNIEKKYEITENGLRINFDFQSAKIKFDVLFEIINEKMIIKIPLESIEEYGDFMLVAIDMLKFFGSAEKDETGYIFYPDGCGALYNFKSENSVFAQEYIWNVYYEDTLNMYKWWDDKDIGKKNAMLPVFGVKKDSNAYTAIISDGEAESRIRFSPSGFKYEINRINCQFVYRRSYVDGRFKIDLYYYENDLLTCDHEIQYVFLEGDDADYSGMACAFREYAISNGILKDNNLQDDIPLALDLLMGAKEERDLFDRYIKMTTFDNAIDIVQYFNTNMIDNIILNLKGYDKNGYGYFPDLFSVSSRLGGKRGLEKLIKSTGQYNTQVLLEANILQASNNSKGYSLRKDVVLDNNQIHLSHYQNGYILSPDYIEKILNDNLIPNIKKTSVAGITFDKIAEILYFNANEEKRINRYQTEDIFKNIISTTKEIFEYSACRGGNMYVLKDSNLLYDIPYDDSGYMITDDAVPFYQIVVHGSIPYTSTAGNLTNDLDKKVLKWIEYGYIPYFELTWFETYELLNTNVDWLFSSEFDYWKENIVNVMDVFNKKLNILYDKKIINHTKISDNFYVAEYENGMKVYVNYNKEAKKAGNIMVEAENFLVVN